MKRAEKIRIGTYDCWALPDGEFTYPGNTLLPAEGEPPEGIDLPYTALLVDTGSVRVLIDTGAGVLGPKTGRLPNNLAAAGFTPDDIHTIVISHAHPDHIAGLGQFPNAAVVMSRKEFEFWTADDTATKLQAGELYGLGALEQLMASSVHQHLLPVRDRLRLVDQPTELANGILIFSAPGHTPGHSAVLISSGRQQLLYAGDALLHPEQFAHPDWTSAFDLLRDETVLTRRKLLDRITADRCMLAAFHLPGAVGTAEARHASYRWESVF